MGLYLPSREEILTVAGHAHLNNPRPAARESLRAKVEDPRDDWDERSVLTVPGVVWTVSSDTCATGRLNAPDNVAYDDLYREFVFRQPANDDELAAVMGAEADEVFSCYRFDGLDRWTGRSVGAWMADLHVVVGYVRQILATSEDPELLDCLGRYEAYLISKELSSYLSGLRRHLDSPQRGRRHAGS